jgi:hypothetical protein
MEGPEGSDIVNVIGLEVWYLVGGPLLHKNNK